MDPSVSGEWRATGETATVGVFIGALTAGSIFQAWVLQPGLLDAYMLSTVASWEIAGHFAGSEKIAGLEIEASASQHFGFQDHAEFTVAGVARWHAFLIDDVVTATASVSQGLSYATGVPRIEEERWGEGRRLMSHNSYEFSLADRGRPELQLVFRLHHRSGVWGLFGAGIEEGSNVASMGIKYRFRMF